MYSLERAHRLQNPEVDPIRILCNAVERVSDEDFHLLWRVREGTINSDELTDRDFVVLQDFIESVEQECRRLGFSSWAALQPWAG
jgi:hypothetical protein